MTDYKLVPVEPTAEMVEAAQDAYMPFGDMDIALRMAILAAPAVQGEPVAVLLIGEPEHTKQGWELGDWDIEPNATAIEAFAKLAEPGAYQLCLAPHPAEQQPAPDVAGLVEALEAISRNELDAQRAQHVASIALVAHRKQGGE